MLFVPGTRPVLKAIQQPMSTLLYGRNRTIEYAAQSLIQVKGHPSMLQQHEESKYMPVIRCVHVYASEITRSPHPTQTNQLCTKALLFTKA